jgi:TPR repeat protein
MFKQLISVLFISAITFSTSFAATATLTQQAERGDHFAAYQLATEYDNQTTDSENSQKLAVKWYEKSAEAGFETAQMKLAFKYALGHGTEKNMQKAYTWFAVAAAGGNETAIAYREKAKLELNEKQLTEADSLAKVWIDKFATKK